MNKAVVIAVSLIASFIFFENAIYAESPIPESASVNNVDDKNINTTGADVKSAEEVSKVDNLTLLFTGDIMGHDSQIRSALQPDGLTYDYNSCFEYIRKNILEADIAIGNLEVTLAGPPYKGYPRFSSPDVLALACKNAGIDVLVTANNHCVDRGKEGLERTIKTLDNLDIPHTGTFLSLSDKQKKSPLVIEKNNFKIAVISYTFSTNEIPVPKPSIVNLYKIDKLKEDIAKAKSTKPDVIILYIHWGTEYRREPDKDQIALADICFTEGVNIIIGSHPHVLQKSVLKNYTGSRRFVAYSLGNFIANQKAPKTDGGQIIQLTLSKEKGITTVKKAEYMLTWIYGPVVDRKKKFYILPCKDFENRPEFFSDANHYKRMKVFIDESRMLLETQNENVEEIK